MGWNELTVDSNGHFFRQKVVAQFILKIATYNEKKGNKEKNTNKLASFNKLLPPILVKPSKEVNKILKYFKKKKIKQNKN